MELHIYRVVVRGRFADLDDASRAALVAALDEHDILRSAYTADGTLTYEKAIDFFSFRLEVRHHSDDRAESEAAVAMLCLDKTKEHLAAMGVACRDLKVTTTDMADMWR